MGLDSLVREACKHTQGETTPRDKLKINIIGVGGAGNNSVNRLHRIGISGASTLAINTDKLHLQHITADDKMLIGEIITHGIGAGGDPYIGERCATYAKDKLRKKIGRNDIVFITVGMGGGTGTGAAPVIAELSAEMGAIVIAIAATPFKVERSRMSKAGIGLDNLRHFADCTIVLDNNRLLKIAPNLPVDQAFSVMDQLMSEVIVGLTELITQPSLINIDYADVRTIMCNGDTATILYGECSDEDPAKVVLDALKNPLLDIDYTGAKGALVHITGGPRLSLKTAHKVVEGITHQLDPSANVIFGARINPEFEGRIKVITIMTGVHSPHLLSKTSINYVPLHQEIAEAGTRPVKGKKEVKGPREVAI